MEMRVVGRVGWGSSICMYVKVRADGGGQGSGRPLTATTSLQGAGRPERGASQRGHGVCGLEGWRSDCGGAHREA